MEPFDIYMVQLKKNTVRMKRTQVHAKNSNLHIDYGDVVFEFILA